MESTPELWVCRLGAVEYREALALQERVPRARQAGEIPDVLLLLEHPPVYTRGRRSDPASCRSARTGTAAQGIDIVDVDRGGKVTYHGPGQLVGYPIMRVNDVVAYVRTMERAIVAALAEEGVAARAPHRGRARLHGRLGRRPQDRLDRRARRARRHHARLRDQRRQRPRAVQWVVPCGLTGVRMTSLPRETAAPRLPCFRKRAAYRFAQAHGLRQRLVSADRLRAALGAAPVAA